MLDPRDQPERERDRHRIVAARLRFERGARRRLMCVKRSVGKTAAASVDATTAPSRDAGEPREVEELRRPRR